MEVIMNVDNIIDCLPSQAIKDATMAYFISQNLNSNGIFIHYNGSYHSKDYEGIYWYLKSINPQLNILTIGCEEQENISKLNDGYSKADYIIVTPKKYDKNILIISSNPSKSGSNDNQKDLFYFGSLKLECDLLYLLKYN